MNILKNKILNAKSLGELRDLTILLVSYTEKQYFKENQELFKKREKELEDRG
ncbi:hypothetical protein NE172_01970 [Clostridium botulinum]|uniref:hypothetical protein n=1 Tax=Clostridium botulinum TaxID=1491 RepID=UPI0001AADB93|nr:hypothetical protein [Clostridium botulinum]EES50104.1 hypothetical protein CLO_0524 [Clostridium botulinum E1 str. 'BoNT E Beluga']MBY6759713.1 hypothetical protein [Clostridium botulinum]MBY6918622.1 hypothetical protein [Clostridium botulinum]MCR1129706.1 hypothetical protein [Clostridium botulinum]HBZ6635244.1 hypothetical protein [Clostridium botulinum]